MTATLSELPAITSSPQVWDAAELAARSSWRHDLPALVAAEFECYLQANPTQADDIESFGFDAATMPAMFEFADQVRRSVLHQDGVALIRGLDELGLSEAEQRLFYVAFGTAMGTPMTQYGLLCPVRDTGRDHRSEMIPVSKTSAETDFHTDSSAAEVNPDFVGLLCETPSLNGGESMVSNALHAYRRMRTDYPEALRILESKQFVRDIVTPGVENLRENLIRNRIPVFARSERREGLEFRYMRYWIERGQQRAGQPLDCDDLGALDALDEVLSDPAHVQRFHLRKGDMLWVNNRTVAHNRSAYRDTPDNVRQLQRMWIRSR